MNALSSVIMIALLVYWLYDSCLRSKTEEDYYRELKENEGITIHDQFSRESRRTIAPEFVVAKCREDTLLKQLEVPPELRFDSYSEDGEEFYDPRGDYQSSDHQS